MTISKVDPKQFVQTPPRYLLSALGDDLLTAKDPDHMSNLFHNTLGGLLDKEYLHTLHQSREVLQTAEQEHEVLDLVHSNLKTMSREANTPPIKDWVANSTKFKDELQKRVQGQYDAATNSYLETDKKNIVDECVNRYGEKAYTNLNATLKQIDGRMGALSHMIEEFNEVFSKNSNRIFDRWKIQSVDDIFAVGLNGPLPAGFDSRDILQVGGLVLNALKNPELSQVDLFNVQGAADIRDSLKASRQMAMAGPGLDPNAVSGSMRDLAAQNVAAQSRMAPAYSFGGQTSG